MLKLLNCLKVNKILIYLFFVRFLNAIAKEKKNLKKIFKWKKKVWI